MNFSLGFSGKVKRWILSSEGIVWVYSLVMFVGLLSLCKLGADFFVPRISSSDVSALSDWVYLYYFPDKRIDLLFYVLATAGSIAFLASVILFVHQQIAFNKFLHSIQTSKILRWTYLLLVVGINGFFLVRPHSYFFQQTFFSISAVLLWCIAFLLPVVVGYQKELLSFEWELRLERISLILTALLFLELLWMMWPFLKGCPPMLNEYFDIPETTYLDGSAVDNTTFINEKAVGGLLRYDPRKDAGQDPIPRIAQSISIPWSERLDRHLSDSDRNTYLAYEKSRNLLVVNRGLQTSNLDDLENIINNNTHPELFASISGMKSSKYVSLTSLYYDSNNFDHFLATRKKSSQMKKFLDANKLNFNWQILSRWVIHHHSYIMAPAMQMDLGRPLSEINMQYGWFNSYLAKSLMNMCGGISWQTYFPVWFSVWPFYYLFFVLLSFYILRSWAWTALLFVISVASIQWINFQFLFLGPGLNPLRHIFDLPILFFMWNFLKSRRPIWTILSMAFFPIAILNNAQFGLFLVSAWCLTMIIWTFEQRQSWRWVVFPILEIILILLALHLWPLGRDVFSPYFMKGVLSFPIRGVLVYFPIGIFFLACLWLLIHHTEMKPSRYLTFFAIIYSQIAYFYYVWGATEKHLLNILPILAMGGVFFLWHELDEDRRHLKGPVQAFLILTVTLLFYLPTLFVFIVSKQEYYAYFKSHKTYQWDFPTARFLTTMPPDLFKQSVSIIDQYEGSHPNVFMISKYDDLLPQLAGKYSALPFFDLQYFLLGTPEMEEAVNYILIHAPTYIFVDTDIDRNHLGDIVNPMDADLGLYSPESISRVQRLNALKELFSQVSPMYQKKDSRGLLTVYELKTGSIPPAH